MEKVSSGKSQLIMDAINNVFITHEGLVLKNFKLVPQSHFNLCGSADHTFYFSFWKLAMEQYLVSSFGKSLKKLKLNDQTYLHVYTKWFGYYFWLTDVIPKLVRTQDLHDKVVLIYPEGLKEVKYVNETLEMFPELRKRVIPSGVHMQVINLILPKTRQWSGRVPKADVELIKSFLSEYLKRNQIDTNLGERIYISRSKAFRRKPINEVELGHLLTEYGYTFVCMEDYSFLEQVSIIANARFVIGLHGAGLANCLMMEPGGCLIELAPEVRNSKELRTSFMQLAQTAELHYQVVFSPVELLNEADIYDNNLMIDIPQLNAVFKRLS